MDRLYLAVVVPVGIFWAMAELCGFLRRQKNDVRRSLDAIDRLAVSQNEMCAQMKETHAKLLEVKLAVNNAVNKRRDDELAKVARDKVRENDAADAKHASLYVDLAGVGGSKIRETRGDAENA